MNFSFGFNSNLSERILAGNANGVFDEMEADDMRAASVAVAVTGAWYHNCPLKFYCFFSAFSELRYGKYANLFSAPTIKISMLASN